MESPVLEVQSVSKRFGALQALDGVSIAFMAGEIHCVLGENGAGKSTLMNVLAGFVSPDSGSVVLDGQALRLGKPTEIRRLGLAMVHQHFMLVPRMTVGENLALSSLASPGGLLDSSAAYAQAVSKVPELTGIAPANAMVEDLPVGQRQRIELLKALAQEARVLVLDEPTAVLTPDEVSDLFSLLAVLKGQGKTIILIAHKLSEVLAIADRVTVLRRGVVVGRGLRAEVDEVILTDWMVGEVPAVDVKAGSELGSVLLKIEGLGVRGQDGHAAVKGVSFEVKAGEILGVGGVDGNGQAELAEALAGVRPFSGVLEVRGSVGYIPQDRQQAGLALALSVEENLWIGAMDDRRFYRGPFLKQGEVKAWCAQQIKDYDIRVGSASEPVGSLSGGNQQKVVVARVLSRKPGVLVVVSPTRGLDIKATVFVRHQIRLAALAGAAVVLISTDLDELAEVADRVVYMSRGVLADRLLGDTA